LPKWVSATGRWRAAGVCIAGGLLLAGCGGYRQQLPQISQEAVKAEQERQVAYSFETMITQTKRLQSAAFRVMTANTQYCGGSLAPAFGLSVLSLENLSETLRPVAASRLGLDNAVAIVHVVKDSPARRAGLAPGDRVVAVAGQRIPEGLEGTKTLAQVLARAQPDRAIRFNVLRGGRELSFPLRPVAGCATRVVLSGQSERVAAHSPARIVVRRELLRYAVSDDELALVIAHELAHITQGHLRGSRRDRAAGELGGFPVDARVTMPAPEKSAGIFGRGGPPARDVFSPRQEIEADYVGMYFMARAGYDTAAVEPFWRKLTQPDVAGLPFVEIHPLTPERFAVISRTHDEIQLKRSAKAPLIPNTRSAR